MQERRYFPWKIVELSSWKSTNIVTMLHGDVEKLLKVYIFAW